MLNMLYLMHLVYYHEWTQFENRHYITIQKNYIAVFLFSLFCSLIVYLYHFWFHWFQSTLNETDLWLKFEFSIVLLFHDNSLLNHMHLPKYLSIVHFHEWCISIFLLLLSDFRTWHTIFKENGERMQTNRELLCPYISCLRFHSRFSEYYLRY